MSDYFYWGNCTNSTGEDIWALQESSKAISWRAFKRAIADAREKLEEIGAVWEDTTDKQIEDSSFLDFNKGVFMGRPAYFIDWSHIEWIWVKGEENPGGQPRVVSDEMKAEIARFYKFGFRTEALAKVFHMEPKRISAILKELGIELTRPPVTDPDVKQHIVEIILTGKSERSTAKDLGLTREQVKGVLRKYDVIAHGKKGRPAKLSEEDKEEIRRLFVEHVPYAEIAERFGIVEEYVRMLVKGVKRSPSEVELARAKRDRMILDLCEQGLTQRQIGKIVGLSHSTVLRRIQKLKSQQNPLKQDISAVLGIASISFLMLALGLAIRSLKMKKRRDPGPGRTAAVGNSITAARTGFVSFLAQALPARSFENMGIVGEGAAAIKNRLERNVIGQGFDEVIIEAGINDIRRNNAVEYITAQLESMVRAAKQAGLKVILVTLPPWHQATVEISAVNSHIKSQGLRWGADVVVDIHGPLADWRGHLRQELVGDQMGLHPNREGQELIGRAILEAAYG